MLQERATTRKKQRNILLTRAYALVDVDGVNDECCEDVRKVPQSVQIKKVLVGWSLFLGARATQ